VTKLQKTYYQIFFFTLLVCWSPLKPLGYILPFLVLAWLIINNIREKLFSVSKLLFLCVWLAMMGLSMLYNNDFVIQNAILAFFTYSSFYIFLFLPTEQLASKVLITKMVKLTFVFLALEAVVGFVQGLNSFLRNKTFDLSAGDAVDGTIHISLASASDFSNVMFAVNLAFCLIFIMPFFSSFSRKKRVFVLLGLFVLIMTSVMHLLVFAAIAITISYLIFNPGYIKLNLKKIIAISIIIAFPVILVANMLATNIGQVPYFLNKILEGGTPKSQVVIRLFTEASVEYPQVHYIGLGPGQFSSRASLIGTGMYFGSPSNPRKLPLLEPIASEPFEKYILDLWLWVTNLPFAAGSTMAPFASWISFYSEFGSISFVLLILALIFILFRIRAKSNSLEKKRIAFAFGTALLLLFLLGAQENYWEVPQAIFVGLLLLKVFYGLIAHSKPSSGLLQLN